VANNLSDAEENRLLDLSLPTGAGAIQIRLRSTAPTDAADGTAIGGGNDVTEDFAVGAAAAGTKSNSAEILFPAAVAQYSVQGYDFYVGAERRWYHALPAPDQRTVEIGDQYRIAAGDLDFSLS
jgi:hypothetical protein